MSIYLGNTKISGNAKELAFPLFTPIFQDHTVNNASWLRSDTFSWQSGAIYVAAYNHLVDDISRITAETETISSTTITFKRASDGHKIVDDTQLSNVEAIYTATGVAWYYVLDTVNERFKLPRSKWNFVGLRGDVGGYVAESLPNITGIQEGLAWRTSAVATSQTGAFKASSSVGASAFGANTADATNYAYLGFDASQSSSTYQNNAPVQQRATQAYLYFYVGNTIQNETSVDVAELAEDLNGKADIDLGNLSNAGKIVSARMSMPSYTSIELTPGAASYTAPADGWVYAKGTTTTANGYIYGYADPSAYRYEINSAGTTGLTVAISFPVMSGQGFYIGAGGATFTFIRFVYAEGSKSLA